MGNNNFVVEKCQPAETFVLFICFCSHNKTIQTEHWLTIKNNKKRAKNSRLKLSRWNNKQQKLIINKIKCIKFGISGANNNNC